MGIMRRIEARSLYSFIIFLIISVFLSGAAITVSLKAINANNHKFCEVVKARVEYPPPKPEGQRPSEASERAWATYQAWLEVGKSIGCGIQEQRRSP